VRRDSLPKQHRDHKKRRCDNADAQRRLHLRLSLSQGQGDCCRWIAFF
jgi:hypothetical protein